MLGVSLLKQNSRKKGTLIIKGPLRNLAIVGSLLRGSWDLVTRVIIKATTLICTYNPKLGYLYLYLLSPMNLQVI